MISDSQDSQPHLLRIQLTMEKLFVSVALIRDMTETPSRLLLRRDPASGEWRFVVGERLQSESFRETIVRETAWQLELDPQSDLLVSDMAQLSVESIEKQPGSAEPLHLAIAFYPVHLYGRAAKARLNTSEHVGWFTSREILAGRCDQGTAIDPRVVAWLKQWEVLQPWQ